MLRSELESAACCATAALFLDGTLSGSNPFASRFFRLSRLLRFDLAPSAWSDALCDGAGEDLAFKSDNAPLFNGGALPGGRVGELMLDDGPEDPG